MKFFLALKDNIVIVVIQEIIECVDVNGVIPFFSFMDKGFFIIRIATDIDIRSVTGIDVKAITGDIGKRRARLFK